MKGFIEVTCVGNMGKTFHRTINCAMITDISNFNNQCSISVIDTTNAFIVVEDYQNVLRLIENALK